jgi:hypothetical protein
MSQVGTDRLPAESTKHEVLSTTPEGFINEWMEVYKNIGGRSALETFARENPIKFYDQLMKLLVSMEAPKQVMSIHLGQSALTEHELESLSTLELKKRLMSAPDGIGAIVDGDFKID